MNATKITRGEVSMDEIKTMLRSGLYLKVVSAASGYSVPELSAMCRAWGIQRKRGPRPKRNKVQQ